MNRLSQLSQNLSQVNILDRCRKSATVEAQDWKEVMYGRNWHWRERGIKYILTHLDKHFFPHVEELSRKEQRKKASELIDHYSKTREITIEEYDQDHNVLTLYSNAVFSYSPGFCVKQAVHILLYLKTLVTLGTERHHQLLTRAYQQQDLGCFALTEALHGTNVKGMMTEAHYDHKTRQFIVHSPSKDAMKFWIGAAGSTSTISAVWAQLYIGDTCYGVHVFIVPLRDEKTHDLLPGVLIGDCGPKNGVNEVDNGFILFDRVRIPVTNLLNRLSGVDSEGKFYNKCSSEQARFGLQLGAISGGRIAIAMSAPTTALNALSIAVRYCCVRRQFGPDQKSEQTFLYDYPLTRFRMVPLMAQAVVYQLVGCEMNRLWDLHYKLFLEPDNKMVDEMHAISSVLKAKSSWFASDVVRECRQMMGGHGYSSYSRLGNMYHDNDINKTWEGDNSVLLQQSTKYVLQSAQNLTKGQPIEVENLKFLSDPPEITSPKREDFLNIEFLERLFQARVSESLQATGMRLLELKMKKLPIFDIWNNAQVHFGFVLALRYGDLIYLQKAKSAISKFNSEANRKVFTDCIILWALRSLTQDRYGNADTQQTITLLMEQKCDELANQSVALLDFMAAPSKILGSCFADEKGKGMGIYLNQIFTAKGAFKKVDWYRLMTNRDRA